MIRRLALALLAAVSITPGSVHATRLAGEFMAVGGGARALGMGGAFAAVAGDASTVYWNPAGISGVDKRQVLAMHSERFGDLVNYNFAAYVQPSRLIAEEYEAAFGFALIHQGVDDLIITNHLRLEDTNGDGIPNGTETLLDENGNRYVWDDLPRESDNAFALLSTFALSTEYGRVGGTLKLIYNDAIDDESMTGIGIDLGYLYRGLLVDDLDVGVKIQDATGTYLSWSTGTNEFIIPMVKVGAAYEIAPDGLNGSLLLAVDSDLFFDDRRSASQFWVETMSSDVHAGAELQFQNTVMVRGGLDGGRGFDELNPTAGAGLRFTSFGVGFGFDYAYLHHDAFDATHRVSVLADF
jgi:hypothetical protein